MIMLNKILQKKEPLFHIVKRTSLPIWKSSLFRVAAIILGLFLGCIILWICNDANPIAVISELWVGNFGSTRKAWITVRETSLLLITALALIPAFKMKFWNLGGNGQILISALVSIICMKYMGEAGIDDWIIIVVMTFCSILAGAIWAVIPAIFKAFFNTNESLFTLMMNYIATGLVALFLAIAIKSGSGVMPAISTGMFPQVIEKSGSAFFPLIFAIVIFGLIYVYLRFLKHGYELDVVGESQNTARYIGINVKLVVIRTVALSGALCGVVGLLLSGAINGSINANSAKDLGFTAIMASWLGKFNPFYMIITSFFISFLNNGMSQVQMTFGIQNDAIAKVVIGLIYFCVIGVEFFVSYQIVPTKNKKAKNVETKTDNVQPVLETNTFDSLPAEEQVENDITNSSESEVETNDEISVDETEENKEEK